MQNLNSGIGDLKRLTFVRSDATPAAPPAVPRRRRLKIVWLIVAVFLTTATLYVALFEILLNRALYR